MLPLLDDMALLPLWLGKRFLLSTEMARSLSPPAGALWKRCSCHAPVLVNGKGGRREKKVAAELEKAAPEVAG